MSCRVYDSITLAFHIVLVLKSSAAFRSSRSSRAQSCALWSMRMVTTPGVLISVTLDCDCTGPYCVLSRWSRARCPKPVLVEREEIVVLPVPRGIDVVITIKDSGTVLWMERASPCSEW